MARIIGLAERALVLAPWWLHPGVIRAHANALLVLVALECARYAFDHAKFGREASYHMWSSKVWGIVLFTGFTRPAGVASRRALTRPCDAVSSRQARLIPANRSRRIPA
jgi:hypothetical protein